MKEVRGTLSKKKADALVVTALDEVACKESNDYVSSIYRYPTGFYVKMGVWMIPDRKD